MVLLILLGIFNCVKLYLIFLLLFKTFIIISRLVVINTHTTAMAMPTETDPCSNSLVIKVETVMTFGGLMIELATSSLNEIINVIMAAELMLGAISGKITFLNV